MLSQGEHSRSCVQLYESLGWNTLVCHSQFLDMFFPGKALPLAVDVVKELANEVRIRPCPKSICMAKVLKVLEGKGEAQLNMVIVLPLRAGLLSAFPF